MDDSFDARYRAVRSRDTRFDGRFFTGVTSTGIYCRPVCPARTPKRENIRFYRWAAAAERDGFRPCRRCRPEVGPDSPEWDRRGDLVGRALRLIADGVVDTDGVKGLATRLGTSERHLQRVVREEVGVTPGVLARSRRAALARRLLRESDLDVTAVAFAAGFASIRTFNETMRKVHDATPTQLRAWAEESARGRVGGELRMRLATRPPFDGAAVLDHLAARAVTGLEEIGPSSWRRVLRVGDESVVVTVTVAAEGVELALPTGLKSAVTPVVATVRRAFDLDADPDAVATDLSGGGGLIASLVQRHRGLRVPGAVDGFESAVRIVLAQQVSVGAAATHAGRLVGALGEPLDESVGSLTHAFPTAETLAAADLSVLAVPARRRETIAALARAVVGGGVVLDGTDDPARVLRHLGDLPGVGPWTADMIALRVLRDPDVMPRGDLVLRRAVDDLDAVCRTWRPWRSYAAQHLWSEETRR